MPFYTSIIIMMIMNEYSKNILSGHGCHISSPILEDELNLMSERNLEDGRRREEEQRKTIESSRLLLVVYSVYAIIGMIIILIRG